MCVNPGMCLAGLFLVLPERSCAGCCCPSGIAAVRPVERLSTGENLISGKFMNADTGHAEELSRGESGSVLKSLRTPGKS